MTDVTECQYHNNCGGWCETPDEQATNLCSDCLEASRMDDRHTAQLAELRQALRAYDLAGPETAARSFALRAILTLARQLTEE